MIWHVVRFDFADVDDGVRSEIEHDLQQLATGIDEVRWLRVARDVEEPAVTGLITVFADEADLATYRDHPEHRPVVQRIRDAGVGTVRMDLETADDPGGLP